MQAAKLPAWAFWRWPPMVADTRNSIAVQACDNGLVVYADW